MRRAAFVIALFASLQAEVVDRIAVTVGATPIALSAVRMQVRVAALLNGEPLRITPEALRIAADKLADQLLLRKELGFTQFSEPDSASADIMVASLIQQQFGGDAARYREALTAYDVGEEELKAALRWQVTLVRFVDFFFRPGVQVGDEDVRDYYQFSFLPELRRTSPNAAAPPFETVSEQLRDVVTQERVDNALDRWLSQSRAQTQILFREGAFAATPVPAEKPI